MYLTLTAIFSILNNIGKEFLIVKIILILYVFSSFS